VGLGLEIRRGRLGRGVFASAEIARGAIVETCPYIEIPLASVGDPLIDYVFGGASRATVLVLFGYGMLYNHSDHANVRYTYGDRRTVVFVAMRTVAPGSELTLNYGRAWWNSRGRVPR
jgi:uncharacterized protein